MMVVLRLISSLGVATQIKVKLRRSLNMRRTPSDTRLPGLVLVYYEYMYTVPWLKLSSFKNSLPKMLPQRNLACLRKENILA